MGKVVETPMRLEFSIVGQQYLCSLTNGTPETTMILGAIRLAIITEHPQIGHSFVALMKDAFRQMAAATYGAGIEVRFGDERPNGKPH